MAKKLKTIYELLEQYSKEEIMTALSKLNEEELSLVKKRCGGNLENPKEPENWTPENNQFFLLNILPKIKRYIKNPNFNPKKRVNNKNKENDENKQPSPTLKEVPQSNEIKENNESNEEIITPIVPQQPKNLEVQEEVAKQSSTKEDLEILDFIRTTMKEELLNSLTEKERIVISLRLGSIDGKYFSTEAIATFLEIEQQEVRNIIWKVLMSYREDIVKQIDQTIENIVNSNQLTLKIINTEH